MDANRQQPYGNCHAGSWVSKPDPFYGTYTKQTVSAYETYGEWKKRMETHPSNFNVSDKVCVPGGYQDRGSPPAMPLPLAPPLPMRKCMCNVGSDTGYRMVNCEGCTDCYPYITLPSYGEIGHKRSVALPMKQNMSINWN